jgi:hypothetical protein
LPRDFLEEVDCFDFLAFFDEPDLEELLRRTDAVAA